MIPQGDFNKQKFITGRKVDQVSTETTFTLKLPFDDFIGLQDLTEGFGFPTEELGYIANHGVPEAGEYDTSVKNYQRHGSILTEEEAKDEAVVTAYRQMNLIGSWHRDDPSPVLTTKLAVSFDVRSLLHEYYPLSGQYGIRLSVTGWTKTTETTPSEKKTQDIYFTNKDMYGDTYAYFVETTQQKIFDISELISLEDIEIYFWQDFTFRDQQRDLIPWKDEFRGVAPANLFLSNFNVYLGLTTDDINDERVFLYTYDDIKFGYEPEVLTNREELDTRTLEFAWVHHDYAEEKFVLVNTPEKLAQYNGKIFWYQLEYDVMPSEEEANELCWRLAPPNWKYLGANYDNLFQIDVCPSITKSKEKYMAIVSFNGTYEKSEALTFTNIIDVDSLNEALAANKNYIFKFYRPATVAEKALHAGNETEVFAFQNQAIAGEWLIEDNTIGNFQVYDENNKVLKNEDEVRFCDIEYYAILHLLTRDTNEEGEEYEYYSPLFDDTESGFTADIVFPENYSMFTEVPYDTTDPYFGHKYEDGHYATTVCKFKINYFWNLNYNDNTLSATVTRHGNTYYINKEMTFGQSGSQGSEYTIKLVLESGSNYALIRGQEFNIGAYVYDRTGRMLTPEEDGSKTMLFVWEKLGPSTVATRPTATIDNTWSVHDSDNFTGNIISGYIRNDYPPIFRVTVTGAADYPISAVRGFMMTNGSPVLVQQYTVMCPNRVEYKSDGSTPIYDPSEFVIESINKDRKYPKWSLIQLKDGDETNEYFTLKEVNYSEVTIPTNQGDKTRPAYTGYKLISNIGDGNSLDPIPHYWDPAMAESCYMCLSADMSEFTEDAGDQIYIRQAIPFVHNVYASSLINSWDGSLTLDEENGAILSTMMSAGTKDNQNRFTGVIMGDWETKGDASLDTPGLYGFTKGEQTFGFKTDGTGFIGKASAGQIQFDGNQALIKSSDENFYLNLNPMKYSLTDLGDFSLNSFTQYSYSPYFLYAKTAKTADVWGQYANFVDNDVTSWTRPFFEDAMNDYFIVDPNNGILTTGGIIAKYGKLGNWMISDNGLYQRFDSQTPDVASRYMYLGFPSAETNESLQALKVIYDQKYLDAYLDYLNKLNQLTVQVHPSIYQLDPIHYWNYGRGLKMAHDILVVTLDRYNKDTSQNLQTVLENTMGEMITEDFIENYQHIHYCKDNYAIPTTSHKPAPRGYYYTGCRTDVYLLLGYCTQADGGYSRNPVANDNSLLPYYSYTMDWYCNSSNQSGGRMATQAEIAAGKASPEGYYIYKSTTETRWKPIPQSKYMRVAATSISPNSIAISYSSMSPGTALYPDDAKPTGSFPIFKRTVKNGSIVITDKNYLDVITVDRMQELIAVWEPTYQNGLNAYLYQLDQQRKAGYEYVPYEDRKELEDEYAQAKAQIDAEYAAAKRALQDADDGRYAIFAGEEETTNPIFYVKWNGDMFARRGLIANTWTIDDHALTYAKNNDIIYLGTQEYTNPSGETWVPKGRVYAGTDDDGNATLLEGEERKWAFSASNSRPKDDDGNTTDEIYPINFGVSLSGELYAQLGTIGGWNITRTSLESITEITDEEGNVISSSIVLDTVANALIFNNGSTIISGDGTIILGALGSDGSTVGGILIGGMSLVGKSNSTVECDYLNYTSSNTTLKVESEATNISFWGQGTLTLPEMSAESSNSSGVTVAQNITTTNILNIVDNTEYNADDDHPAGSGTGISIATGYILVNNNMPTAVNRLLLYPNYGTATMSESERNQFAWLGANGSRWNIFANILDCNDLQMQNGNINAKTIYMDSKLVATQDWVYNELVDVYNAIKSAASKAGGASGRAFKAAGVAAGALNKLADLVTLLSNYKFYVIGTDNASMGYDDGYIKVTTLNFGMAWESLTIGEDTDTGGTGTADNSTSETKSSAYLTAFNIVWGVSELTDLRTCIRSNHLTKFAIAPKSGSTVTCTFTSRGGAGADTDYCWGELKTDVSLSHTHQPSVSWDDTNGKITVTIDDANFSETSLSTDDNSTTLSIATTNWFKARAYGKITPTAGTSNTGEIKVYAKDDTTVLAQPKVVLSTSGSKDTTKVQAKVGTTIIAEYSVGSLYIAGANSVSVGLGWSSSSSDTSTGSTNVSVTAPATRYFYATKNGTVVKRRKVTIKAPETTSTT